MRKTTLAILYKEKNKVYLEQLVQDTMERANTVLAQWQAMNNGKNYYIDTVETW